MLTDEVLASFNEVIGQYGFALMVAIQPSSPSLFHLHVGRSLSSTGGDIFLVSDDLAAGIQTVIEHVKQFGLPTYERIDLGRIIQRP